jgi:hypothetical protein
MKQEPMLDASSNLESGSSSEAAKPAGASLPQAFALSSSEIDAIVSASHGDPFSVLGPHAGADGTWVVRTLQPGARSVQVIGSEAGELLGDLMEIHPAGLFAGVISLNTGGATPSYRLRVTDPEPAAHHEPDTAHLPSDAAHTALAHDPAPQRDVEDPFFFL